MCLLSKVLLRKMKLLEACGEDKHFVIHAQDVSDGLLCAVRYLSVASRADVGASRCGSTS
jgi:hypothetical protein